MQAVRLLRRFLEALGIRININVGRRGSTTPTPPPTMPDMPLPTNPPTAPNPPIGRGEQWDFSIKTWDSSYRIRLPSTLGRPPHNIGPGSWVFVNGEHRAEFRSFDVDHGARRPSYTMPLATPVQFPATAVLYAADGRAVAWFRAAGSNTNGRLP